MRSHTYAGTCQLVLVKMRPWGFGILTTSSLWYAGTKTHPLPTIFAHTLVIVRVTLRNNDSLLWFVCVFPEVSTFVNDCTQCLWSQNKTIETKKQMQNEWNNQKSARSKIFYTGLWDTHFYQEDTNSVNQRRSQKWFCKLFNVEIKRF